MTILINDHLKALKPYTFQKESDIAWGLSINIAGPHREVNCIKYPILSLEIYY